MGFTFTSHQKFHLEEFIPLILPIAMFLLGNFLFDWFNLMIIFIMWTWIMIVGAFVYSLVSLSTGHHDPRNVHEGDEFKSLDYGLYQMATTMERKGVNANLFISLTYFGDHLMHHLFPSLDHALLPQLHDVLFETLKEFHEEYRECSFLGAIIGQFRQLGRSEAISIAKEII